MAQPNSARTTADASSGGSTAGGTSHAENAGNDGGQRDTTLVGRVRERAEATLESQKDRATDGLGSVARAVRGTEAELRSQHQESIADYVAQVAARIDRFSEQLRDKRVHELFDDAQQFARRHPAAFAGSAFAVGLVAARFLKSSGERRRSDSGYGDDAFGGYAEPRYGTSYRSPYEESRDSQRMGTSSGSSSTAAAGATSSSSTTGTTPYASASGFSSGTKSSGSPASSSSGTLSAERGSAAAPGGTGAGAAGGTGAGTTGSTRGGRAGSETERS
jgi:hypothetical protein